MVVGKTKDEYKGISVNKFVGLKSKIYSVLSGNGKEYCTAKGVNIATEFKEYKDALLKKKVMRSKMKRIQSWKYEINKISLSCFDDKRFVLDDDIHTLAYFHKDLRK